MPTISIMRLALSFLFASSILLAGVGPGTAYEPENDRWGGDILHADHDSRTPLSCQKDCFANPACKAWTFMKPQGSPRRPIGHCWLKDSIPDATFTDCCISGVKPSQAFAIRRYIGMIWESADPPLATVTLRYPDPLLCQSACYNNNACNHWSYTSPSPGQPHLCKLFNGGLNPTSRTDTNSISGDKPVLEFNTDRYGSDMARLPGPQLCQKACNDTPGCMSFTYVTPTQGVDAVCWLKNVVSAPIPNGCCIAGAQ
jgi:hypothetical protein